ncbi:MAG: malate dehydrogenase [Prevotella sp.]|jgi:malate dehydrogenase|nr:malate dehydrogenase [Prevotella sp.]MBP6527245.1 malate dehydrogenase [Prevotella sp.]MBP7097129.1 malate dehydrogenase [Prevotella sp.]MBP8685984.1 malate dehydrogenase [Prevotella sp.]MBP8934365.1 malate dehydrogenase [Prevotella sp.]MCI1732359.1 malate dehydrogenase [Prevotella sp.]
MEFLTNDKLVIVGAAGMIGSNMVQTALMLGLTPNITLYDVFSAEGVAEEMRQCGFDEANIVSTIDPKEAFTDAKYIISSGGAPRKEGMTREDLLAGNSKAAQELGENIKKFCPNANFCVVIFNPADITGLVTLVHSGLKPNQVATLAALDSTRLKGALAKHFGVSQAVVENAYTYGGHGEKMAVFASPTTIDGVKLVDVIAGKATVNGKGLTSEEWAQMQKEVTQGGAKIIELRRRSSFQSPAYLAVKMIEAAMGGEEFNYPSGTYADTARYNHVMMAMPTRVTSDGVYTKPVIGAADEIATLDASYAHLQKMRDQVIEMGALPAVADWKKFNSNL